MIKMAPSILRSYALPIVGAAGASPVPIAQAGAAPTRVLIRNYSALAAAWFSFDTNDLVPGSSGVYRIPSRGSDVFLLAPYQRLFAMGEIAGATISVAISEAFPVDVTG